MIMTQEEFIKKFCPDYKDRFNSIREEYRNADDEIISALVELQDKAFEEALQNFTYKICEAQKEICASGSSVYLNINSRPYPNELIAIIIGSVHPNIEDI